MKAPLRFVFGWVLYVAIFAALNPILAAIFEAVKAQPLALTVTSAALALVLLIASFAVFLRRFWLWCDSAERLDNEAS